MPEMKRRAVTRLPADGGTRPPVVRIVAEGDGTGELVLELTYRTLALRPKWSRDPSARVLLTWGAIYRRALIVAAEARREVRQAKRRRR